MPGRSSAARTCARVRPTASMWPSSTSIPLSRARAAIRASGSTPSTVQPRSTSACATIPVRSRHRAPAPARRPEDGRAAHADSAGGHGVVEQRRPRRTTRPVDDCRAARPGSSHAATAAYSWINRRPADSAGPRLDAAAGRDPLRAGHAGRRPRRDALSGQDGEQLLIATWNIAIFGDLTEKWVSAADQPKRNLSDACAIADIISRFDVCAIQETRRNLTALQTVMRILGEDWSYLVTDVTEGDRGNGERLCFIHDRRRARSSGLVGEIVLPRGATTASTIGPLEDQFARTPYAVSFAAWDQGVHARHPARLLRRDARPRSGCAAASCGRSPSGWPIAPARPTRSTAT